jgi:CheY-like chemotaxis protein
MVQFFRLFRLETIVKRTTINIYMIEDDSDDVEFYRMALDERGVSYSLTAFPNPDQAFDNLSSTETLPQLIVLDLNLPCKSGTDVLETIRAHDRFKDIPVMVLTGSQQPGDRERAFELGAKQFVTKPNQIAEFGSLADATLDAVSV